MTATPFESTGVWTTFPEYLAYVNALLAAHPTRLSKVPMTTSAQGREVFAIRVGAADASGSSLLIDASIHGNEQASREAMMILVRELAESTDTATVALLDEHPLYVTCVSPDGWVLDTRDDSTGVNPNRIHLSLIRREVRALSGLVRDIQPVSALNGHEYPVVGGDDQNGAQVTTWPTFSSANHPLVHGEAVAQSRHVFWPAIQAGGYTAGWYPEGSGSDLTWQFVGGFKGIALTLIESNRYDLTEAQRVDGQLRVMRAWINYLTVHIDSVTAAVGTARAEMASRVARGMTTWPVSGNLALPGAWGASTPQTVTSVGYVVTAAQWAAAVPSGTITVAELFEAHGIITYAYGADRWVPLGQPLAPLIVRLIDANASSEVIQATRVTETPAQFASPQDVWASVSQ